MKYTPSVMVGSMSGTSGGTVASSWKGILYVRRHVIPHNPKSAAQIIQRAYMKRMAPWFRSLPVGLVAFLDKLGSPCRLSGFNMMSKADLTNLAATDPPIIVPANADNNSIFSVTDGTSIVTAQVDVDFVAGEADDAHFAHAFTVPIAPDAPGDEEPDAWTYQANPVLVSAGSYDAMPVIGESVDYYVVLIIADTNDLATATVLSGGVSCVAASAA